MSRARRTEIDRFGDRMEILPTTGTARSRARTPETDGSEHGIQISRHPLGDALQCGSTGPRVPGEVLTVMSPPHLSNRESVSTRWWPGDPIAHIIRAARPASRRISGRSRCVSLVGTEGDLEVPYREVRRGESAVTVTAGGGRSAESRVPEGGFRPEGPRWYLPGPSRAVPRARCTAGPERRAGRTTVQTSTRRGIQIAGRGRSKATRPGR